MTTDQKFSQATSTIPIVMSAGDVLLTLRVRTAMSPNVWADSRARGQTIGVAPRLLPRFSRGRVRSEQSGRSRSELPIDGRHRQYSRVCTSAMSGVGTDRQCCSTESISAVEGRPAVSWRGPRVWGGLRVANVRPALDTAAGPGGRGA